MLIVNADDFGMSHDATDNIALCYGHGRITSTTAMVFMEDSERASRIATAQGMGVGLHLNLTQPFSAPGVPRQLQDYHARIRGFLNASKYRFLMYNPWLVRQFEYVFRHQYDEFLRLYQREPTHVDGHHHMHLCTNMLVHGVIPAGTKVRTTFTFVAGEKSPLNRMYRAAVAAWVRRRYRSTHYLFNLAPVVATPSGRQSRLKRIVDAASRSTTVELTVHPQLRVECEYLMGDEYARLLSDVSMIGYASL
jgi:predicted glycoside hydrolase/deacetylase ChbG (UPF0249 family)